MELRVKSWGLDLSCLFVLKSHLDWEPPHKKHCFLLISCNLICTNSYIIAVLPAR